MGLFDGQSYDYDRPRGPSPPRGTRSSNGKGYKSAPRSASFFGGSSSRGWFNRGGSSSSSSSYYRRSPRQGYIAYLLARLQRMLRDLWAYARRHPVRAFFAVAVPLLSAGGAIHGLLRQFGVRVPFVDGPAARSMSGGYYGSAGYGGLGTDLGGGGATGLMSSAGSLMQIAKAFM